jgi:nicotinamide mononucleotide (NMN) deamidase PncC
VGTVWIATAVLPEAVAGNPEPAVPLVSSYRHRFPGERNDVRFGAAMAALAALDSALDSAKKRI